MDTVISLKPDNVTFHAKRLNRSKQRREIIESSLGGMLQDSINELGQKQLLALRVVIEKSLKWIIR